MGQQSYRNSNYEVLIYEYTNKILKYVEKILVYLQVGIIQYKKKCCNLNN